MAKATRSTSAQAKVTGAPAGTQELLRAEGFRQQGKLDEAEKICRGLVINNPHNHAPYVALATVLDQQDRREDAYHCYKQAVSLAPEDFETWRRFGNCLYMLKQFDAALIAFKKAVALNGDHLDTLLALGRTMSHLEKPEEALILFDGLIERYPNSAEAHLQKGLQHQTLGDHSRARSALERALELNPKLTEAHFRLAAMGETADGVDAAVEKLKELASDIQLHGEKRAGAYFSAAKLIHKQKRSAEAFELYRKANEVLKDIAAFDPNSISHFVDLSIQAFNADVFENMADAACDWEAPVFIVGMPRSGTTLTEQIVTSHPSVGAGGEERKMSQLTEALMRESSGTLRYPTHVGFVEPATLLPIGDQYRNYMQQRFPDALRITDKNPFNFFHLGLISVLYPNATILHCQRDPMDTCLSCYLQYFGDVKTLAFTTDLGYLGHFHNEYSRLMDHWHSVLPGKIMDVCYEDMISDQEAMSRMIIDRVGLPWDDACLRFNENERGVRTASQWQVRQPIYTSSVGRWREFETQLEPLRAALEKAA